MYNLCYKIEYIKKTKKKQGDVLLFFYFLLNKSIFDDNNFYLFDITIGIHFIIIPDINKLILKNVS